MHKYAVGIYSATPGKNNLTNCDTEDESSPYAGEAPVPLCEQAQGVGTVETYTVIYDRDQQAARSLIYGRTQGGLRFIANGLDEVAAYAALTGENIIGRQVELRHKDGLNQAVLL
jgi:hypothetical protein